MVTAIKAGEIRKIITPYYDKTQRCTKFKPRPGLILKEIRRQTI